MGANPASITNPAEGSESFVESGSEGTVVWLAGEHDASTVAALASSLARAVAVDSADLIVDLSGVSFMGAETVGVIIRTSQLLRLHGRILVLRSPSRLAQRVLSLCGRADLMSPADGEAVGPGVLALATWVAVPANPHPREEAAAAPWGLVRVVTTDAGPKEGARPSALASSRSAMKEP